MIPMTNFIEIPRTEFRAAIEAGIVHSRYLQRMDVAALRRVAETATESAYGDWQVEKERHVFCGCPAEQAGLYGGWKFLAPGTAIFAEGFDDYIRNEFPLERRGSGPAILQIQEGPATCT